MNDYHIKRLYEEMELDLIASMKRNFNRHLKEEAKVGIEYPQWQAIKLKELKRYQRENQKIIGGYTKGLSKNISKHLENELYQGSISAINQYNSIHKDKKKINKVLNKSFFKTNDRKVNALIKSVNNDMSEANSAALRMINDEYRQIIHKSAFFVANGVKTEYEASKLAELNIEQRKKLFGNSIDQVSKTFLAGGLNCIEYKDGRRVNIASYAQMAVRTASLRAHLMGEGNFRQSIGQFLVQVTSHGGSCALCSGWQGKILVDDVYSGGKPDGKHILLSDAMKMGLLHPNCRHGLTTYYPELEDIEDETIEDNEDNQEKINYYDRNAKKYQRLSNGTIDKETADEYKKKQIAYEKMRDEIVKVQIKENELKYKDYTRAIEKGYWNGEMQYCNDVTNEWLGDPPIKENKVIMPKKGNKFKYKGKEYFIDGHDIVIQFNNGEEEFANLISKKTTKRIELFPRFNEPENMKSADAKIGKEYVDFKITKSGTDHFIPDNIYKARGQANHFAFDITNKEISNDVILYQVDSAFRKFKYVKTIMVNSKYGTYVYKR